MSSILNIQKFYPGEVEVSRISESSEKILIWIKSKSIVHKCPSCGCESNNYHSTYKRKIIDLPILGKSAVLFVTAYKYNCNNTSCEQKSTALLHVFIENIGEAVSAILDPLPMD